VRSNEASKSLTVQPAFSRSFLKSLETAKVSDLKKRFHYQQPLEVEKILAESDLSVGAGMAPRDSDGIRGQNLIYVGGEAGISNTVQRNLRNRHGGPVKANGVDPEMYWNRPVNDSRISLSLHFGVDIGLAQR
jgi:hypothetical protein